MRSPSSVAVDSQLRNNIKVRCSCTSESASGMESKIPLASWADWRKLAQTEAFVRSSVVRELWMQTRFAATTLQTTLFMVFSAFSKSDTKGRGNTTPTTVAQGVMSIAFG